MKQELQDKLVEKYPKIFVNIDKTIYQSCMAWGIECGDGWYKIIDNLCLIIQKTSDEEGNEQVVAAQIKEKFGGLRFYVDGANKEQDENITFAENLSNSTCETCGSMENVFQTDGWIKTICKKCDEKQQKRNEKIRYKSLCDRVGRSEDYANMTIKDQWREDENLGILNWDGTEKWLNEHGK